MAKKIALLLNKPMVDDIFGNQLLDELALLGEITPYDMLPEKMTEEFMLKQIQNADVCITGWGTPPISEAMLDLAPGLGLLMHAAGSVKGVARLPFQRGVRVSGCAPAMAPDVAATALGMIIAGLKRFEPQNRYIHENTDESRANIELLLESRIRSIGSVTIGVVGASLVGRNLINMLKPFGNSVLVSDPFLTEAEAEALGVAKVNLDELLSQSDVVTLHAPILPETAKMINKKTLALMKDNALLVNTARGALVDTRALADEVRSGRIYACLDEVTLDAGETHNPLLGLSGVLLTSGIGGGKSKDSRRDIGVYAVRQIKKFLSGEKLDYEVTSDQLSTIA